MSKPLQAKYFLVLLALLSCGGKKKADQQPTPENLPPTAPLPTAGLAGQRVALMPLTLVGAEDTLQWDSLVANRRVTLDKSDSIIGALLAARAPEVTWVGAGELRRTGRRAAGAGGTLGRLAGRLGLRRAYGAAAL